MSNDYERGLSDGYKGSDASFKSVAPFWVYGAIDNTKLGLEPLFNFVAAFNSQEDAEAFIDYRKSNIRDRETLFSISDHSEVKA